MATPGNGIVKLTWLAPSSNGGATIEKYAVQRYNGGTRLDQRRLPDQPGLHRQWLANGTKYYFRIRAHNAAGWSPVSTVVTPRPTYVVPSAPSSRWR